MTREAIPLSVPTNKSHANRHPYRKHPPPPPHQAHEMTARSALRNTRAGKKLPKKLLVRFGAFNEASGTFAAPPELKHDTHGKLHLGAKSLLLANLSKAAPKLTTPPGMPEPFINGDPPTPKQTALE